MSNAPDVPNDRFTVEIYDEEFDTLLYRSPELIGTTFTPSQAEWDVVRQRAGGEIRWLVSGSQSSTPVSGPYRSCGRTLVESRGS